MPALTNRKGGRVRLNAAVLKTAGCNSPVGSNPTPSAKWKRGRVANAAARKAVEPPRGLRGFESHRFRQHYGTVALTVERRLEEPRDGGSTPPRSTRLQPRRIAWGHVTACGKRVPGLAPGCEAAIVGRTRLATTSQGDVAQWECTCFARRGFVGSSPTVSTNAPVSDWNKVPAYEAVVCRFESCRAYQAGRLPLAADDRRARCRRDRHRSPEPDDAGSSPAERAMKIALVAELVDAPARGAGDPKGSWRFESSRGHQMTDPVVQWSGHQAFNLGTVGSIPPGIANDGEAGVMAAFQVVTLAVGVRVPSSPQLSGCSSVGRARPCHGRGRGFESRRPLQISPGVCSSVGRAPDFHSGGRGFKSRRTLQYRGRGATVAHQPFKLVVVGSTPTGHTARAVVAQSVEHPALNWGVEGSIPSGGTMIIASVAQRSRAAGFYPAGRGFESFQARHDCARSSGVEHSSDMRVVGGSIPPGRTMQRPCSSIGRALDSKSSRSRFESVRGRHWPVAQEVERRPHKPQVAGSSPAGLTTLLPSGGKHHGENAIEEASPESTNPQWSAGSEGEVEAQRLQGKEAVEGFSARAGGVAVVHTETENGRGEAVRPEKPSGNPGSFREASIDVRQYGRSESASGPVLEIRERYCSLCNGCTPVRREQVRFKRISVASNLRCNDCTTVRRARAKRMSGSA